MTPEKADELEPRERCPRCGQLLEHADVDAFEEWCIDPQCGYYRAEGLDGEVIRR